MSNLKQAVIEQLGYTMEQLEDDNEDLMATLSDITNHGVGGGFGGFIYHSDTVAFFDANETEILAHASEMADSFGNDGMYAMIKGFNCLNDDYSVEDIVQAIHVPDSDDETQIKNALAWYAAEEIARDIIDH